MTEDQFITKMLLRGIPLKRKELTYSKKYRHRIVAPSWDIEILTYSCIHAMNVRIVNKPLKHFKSFDKLYQHLTEIGFFNAN